MKKILLIFTALLTLVMIGCGSDMYVSGDIYPARPARFYALTSGWAYTAGDPIVNNYLPYTPPYYPYSPYNRVNYNSWWGYPY